VVKVFWFFFSKKNNFLFLYVASILRLCRIRFDNRLRDPIA